MNKEEFLSALRSALAGLPQEDIEERLAFYSESIDDRMEDGLTEEEAVEAVGTVDEVRDQIMAEIPLTKLVREKMRPKGRLRAWEIILLVLGAPVWIPLLIAAAAVLFSVYICIWAGVICVYAAELGLVGGVIAGVGGTVMYLKTGNFVGALFYAGAAVLCAGLAILLFFGCIKLTKTVVKLTGRMLLGIKNSFVGREA